MQSELASQTGEETAERRIQFCLVQCQLGHVNAPVGEAGVFLGEGVVPSGEVDGGV